MPGHRLDGLTQRWVMVTGRRVDLPETPWLHGPVGGRELVGEQWLHDEARRLGAVVSTGDRAGLLADVGILSGPEFVLEQLSPSVRDFYENTSSWRLDVAVRWSAWAWPLGWLISRVFARRLQQLALPLRRSEVTGGMTSDVTPLLDGERQVSAMWLRRLAGSGAVVYSGCYDTTLLPGAGRRVLRVSFPLPTGRLVVLLEPRVSPTGSLQLSSPAGGWGDPGCYLVVEREYGTWARRVPLYETFDVYEVPGGQLATDHHLRLGRVPVVRLHYRMTRDST